MGAAAANAPGRPQPLLLARLVREEQATLATTGLPGAGSGQVRALDVPRWVEVSRGFVVSSGWQLQCDAAQVPPSASYLSCSELWIG
jgi:hypothetical protein